MTPQNSHIIENCQPPSPVKRPLLTWGEAVICGLILWFAAYALLFTILLADVLYLDRNLIVKRIDRGPGAVKQVLKVIYGPQILLLKAFRIIPA